MTPLAWLRLQELSGDILANVLFTPDEVNLLANPDFATGDFTGWTVETNPPDGEVVNEGYEAHFTYTTSTTPKLKQDICVVGKTYTGRFDLTAIAAGSAGFEMADNTAAFYNTAGVKEITRIATSNFFRIRSSGTSGTDFTADDAELYLVGELDGANVGASLNSDTFLGLPCPTFVGDYIQLEHNGLEDVFDPALGSFAWAIKLAAADWASATPYVFAVIGVDANNRFRLWKPAANTLRFEVSIGGVSATADYSVQASDHDHWLQPVCTWNSAGDISLHVKTTTATAAYPAGTWTSSDLTAAFCRLMSENGANHAPGSGASFLPFDRELSTEEAQGLYIYAQSEEPDLAA